MQVYRAQEILQSNERIEVELNGMSVWIDSIDADKQTAKVHAEENPADSKTVSVEDLQEIQ